MDNISFVFSALRHELGNPVNSIKTALTVLREELDDLPKERIAADLDRMLMEVDRVEYLLRAFKTFNLFGQPHIEPLEVTPFLTGFASLVAEDLQRRNVALEIQASHDLGRILADPHALHQALLNLVSNAADAVAGRPDPHIRLRSERRGHCIVVEVEDNGVGITAAQKAQLFRPFCTGKPNGNGLGLAIVQKLVTRMGGTVEIESQPGAGTLAALSLPAEERQTG